MSTTEFIWWGCGGGHDAFLNQVWSAGEYGGQAVKHLGVLIITDIFVGIVVGHSFTQVGSFTCSCLRCDRDAMLIDDDLGLGINTQHSLYNRTVLVQ